MNIKPIKTEADYPLAMQRLEALFDAKKESEVTLHLVAVLLF
jgi:antitoxin component HigA of HigAB toxin-antitoxin module